MKLKRNYPFLLLSTGKDKKFEDTKWAIIRLKAKKNRQHNDQKKKNKRTNTTQKTKDRKTRIPLKTGKLKYLHI